MHAQLCQSLGHRLNVEGNLCLQRTLRASAPQQLQTLIGVLARPARARTPSPCRSKNLCRIARHAAQALNSRFVAIHPSSIICFPPPLGTALEQPRDCTLPDGAECPSDSGWCSLTRRKFIAVGAGPTAFVACPTAPSSVSLSQLESPRCFEGMTVQHIWCCSSCLCPLAPRPLPSNAQGCTHNASYTSFGDVMYPSTRSAVQQGLRVLTSEWLHHLQVSEGGCPMAVRPRMTSESQKLAS